MEPKKETDNEETTTLSQRPYLHNCLLKWLSFNNVLLLGPFIINTIHNPEKEKKKRESDWPSSYQVSATGPFR